MIGFIGGSGLYDIPGLEISDSAKISTPYGEPSEVYRIGRLSGRDIAFLPRHGTMHHIQPHRINYRANIWGFRELGVAQLFSVGASGGISPGMKPGVITVPDQIIDTTSGRPSTFFDEDEVVHIDFTEPFCPGLRSAAVRASEMSGIPVIGSGTYICVNGPRLETAAEIKAFALLGADMVGMTAMPEASLARELEICFAGISVITNFAAGIAGEKLTATEVVETMKQASQRLRALLLSLMSLDFPAEKACACRQALKDAKM